MERLNIQCRYFELSADYKGDFKFFGFRIKIFYYSDSIN